MFLILLLILISAFILLTFFVINYPIITVWDREIIVLIQNFLQKVPQDIPIAFDALLYYSMIAIILIAGIIYFIKKKRYFDIAYFALVPLITYKLSDILKCLIERPRPPVDLHYAQAFGHSYVSSHTLVIFCLMGMATYYLINYSKNKTLNIILISLASIWVVAIGFSRVWLGVHHLTDVFAAYILGIIFLMIFIKTREFFDTYFGL